MLTLGRSRWSVTQKPYLILFFVFVNDLIFFCADPSSVELNIDGSTDKCSKGEDINFIFTGFTLSGKVLSFVPFNSLSTESGEFKSCMTFLCMITGIWNESFFELQIKVWNSENINNYVGTYMKIHSNLIMVCISYALKDSWKCLFILCSFKLKPT